MDDSMNEFYRDLERENMDALWRFAPGGQGDGESAAPYPPHRWSWATIRPFMTRAAELVTPGPNSERRVVQLVHPALGASRSAAHTLMANVQMVLPGEIAPPHRHSFAAIRFIIEGDSAVTFVDGEPVEMRPGDLVLTPGMHWHGHTNESDSPTLWMDALDIPVTFALRQMRFESYPTAAQPLTRGLGDASARFGTGLLRPLGVGATAVSPIMSYPWAETESALQRLAEIEVFDPFDDIALDYRNPLGGGHVLPTIGCRMQMLRPNVHTQAHRHAYASVYHMFRGSGATIVDGARIDWKSGDFLTVPPFAWHEHHNETNAPAYLFSVTDEPIIDALNFSREDVLSLAHVHA
jgi:gentisate 1,2-dioxygenase